MSGQNCVQNYAVDAEICISHNKWKCVGRVVIVNIIVMRILPLGTVDIYTKSNGSGCQDVSQEPKSPGDAREKIRLSGYNPSSICWSIYTAMWVGLIQNKVYFILTGTTKKVKVLQLKLIYLNVFNMGIPVCVAEQRPSS